MYGRTSVVARAAVKKAPRLKRISGPQIIPDQERAALINVIG